MVSNRRIFRLLIIIIFVFICPFAFSQNYNYFLDTVLDFPRFIQHISWSKEEFALYYEVVIQRRDGEYGEYRRESTEDAFLNVSLPPGKYRFNVLPYDLLGQAGQVSEWRVFDIFTAYQPSLEKFYPLAFYMNIYSERALEISGSNLFEDTEIYLRNNNNSLLVIDKIIGETNRIMLFFDDDNLIPGTYEIYIRNPGGLESATEGFFIGYRRPVDFFIKLSWAPVIPVYGEMFNTFDSKLYLTGAELNFGAITSRRSFFNYGLELSVSAYALYSMFSIKPDFKSFLNGFLNSNIETGASWVELNLNMLLRKYFLKKIMAVTLRSGAGFSFINRSYEYNIDFIFQWNLGLSYMLQLMDIFHMEIGIDFFQYHTTIPSGFIKPRLGFFWNF